jgi:hypothetical protein
MAEDMITLSSALGKLLELDKGIEAKIGHTIGNKRPSKEVKKEFDKLHPEIPEDIYLPEQEIVPFDSDKAEMPEANNYTPRHMTNMLPVGGELLRIKVMARRKQDHSGKPMGKVHLNPMLNTCLYKVEFPDGSMDAFGANIIAESMILQIDDEGHSFQLLKEIIDHETDRNAVLKDDNYDKGPGGNRTPCVMAKG